MSKRIAICLAITLTFGTLRCGFALASQEIINEDCVINQEVFDKEWRKYTELDDQEVTSSSSHGNVREYKKIEERLGELDKEFQQLTNDSHDISELSTRIKEVKGQIATELKGNLLKSLVRLSFYTIEVIDKSASLGKSLAEAIAIQKLRNLGIWATEEAADKLNLLSSDDPELNNEDLKILSEQNLKVKEANDLLEHLERLDEHNTKRMDEILEEAKGLREEQHAWETAEKQRVAKMLVENCQNKVTGERSALTPAALNGNWSQTLTITGYSPADLDTTTVVGTVGQFSWIIQMESSGLGTVIEDGGSCSGTATYKDGVFTATIIEGGIIYNYEGVLSIENDVQTIKGTYVETQTDCTFYADMVMTKEQGPIARILSPMSQLQPQFDSVSNT